MDRMILFVAFLLVLTVLSMLALAERTPDTHTEVTQHGDYRF